MGLLSAIYGLGLRCKKSLYINNPARLPAKVLSIGNLTLGGTGKTPAVIAVAREAKRRGLNPCILTRGYKGKAADISFVSRGGVRLMGPVEAGDEACLMADSLKGVTIIKGRDRFRAGAAALQNDQLAIVNLQAPPLFILDDGFQHWKLHRDVDVVLIDATNPFGNEKLFPEGIMREPFNALERAHVIVITKADMAEEGVLTAITGRIKKYNHEAPIYTATHKPAGITGADGKTVDLDLLRGRKIYSFSGIANPDYFKATLESEGALMTGFRKFRDHYAYKQKDIDDISGKASGKDIVTTEKDMVKLRELRLPDNLYALKIEFSIDSDFYDDIFRRLQ